VITAEHVPPGISKEDHQEGLEASLQNLSKYLVSRDYGAS
jgi:hypothetical protein